MNYNKLISMVYLIAFISLYIQWNGLFGYNGLLPADIYINNINNHLQSLNYNNIDKLLKSGNLLTILSNYGLTIEVLCEIILWIGIISSSLSFIGFSNVIVNIISWICYLTLVNTGQVFTSFQWDILLLEAGFLLIINNLFDSNNHNHWCNRFLIWKLMFCSGIVKIQASCPTWNKLTALEYHFASQCLPTFLAWYANQLPPIILRFSVAMTLLIEVPLTFMLISPFTYIRRIGVYFQVILQVLIMLTGNYTYFNILTLVLLSKSYVKDYDNDKLIDCNDIKNLDIFQFYQYILKLFDITTAGRYIQYLVSIIFIVLSFIYMFNFNVQLNKSYEWWQGDNLSLRLKSKDLDPWILPSCAAAVIICVAHSLITSVSKFKQLFCNKNNNTINLIIKLLFNQMNNIILIFWLILSSSTLSAISSNYSNYIPKQITNINNEYPYLHLVSSYGLFRRMTGVGGDIKLSNKITLSSVKRPEIIIEGYDDINNNWIEIPFKYKPNNISSIPLFVAPHQPRLDWQMWFAALGSYQYNPWLINLIYKLLDPSHSNIEVISLLDIQNYPINNKFKFIRCLLYHYDFTKFQSITYPWIHSPKGSGNSWWFRYNDTIEYIPPIEYNNPSLINYLQTNNLQIRPYKNISVQYNDCINLEHIFVERVSYLLPTWLSSHLHTLLCSAILTRLNKYNSYFEYYTIYLVIIILFITVLIIKI